MTIRHNAKISITALFFGLEININNFWQKIKTSIKLRYLKLRLTFVFSSVGICFFTFSNNFLAFTRTCEIRRIRFYCWTNLNACLISEEALSWACWCVAYRSPLPIHHPVYRTQLQFWHWRFVELDDGAQCGFFRLTVLRCRNVGVEQAPVGVDSAPCSFVDHVSDPWIAGYNGDVGKKKPNDHIDCNLV